MHMQEDADGMLWAYCGAHLSTSFQLTLVRIGIIVALMRLRLVYWLAASRQVDLVLCRFLIRVPVDCFLFFWKSADTAYQPYDASCESGCES